MENRNENKGPVGGPEHAPDFGPGNGPDHGPGHGPGHGPAGGPGGFPGGGPGLAGNAVERSYNSDIFTRRYLDSLLVEMRLIDSDLASTSMDFFGTQLDTPVMLGVMAGYDKEGTRLKAEADAVKECGSVIWLGDVASDDDVRQCVESGVNVVQVFKPIQDNDAFIKSLQHAQDLGCVAVASDIDHAYNKNGSYDEMHGNRVLGPKTSAQLKEISESLDIPFIAKGVLSVQDAVKCKEAGVGGILLSHHHSIMDCAVPPVMILPDVRKAVGDDYMIIVDCSIDTGADAFKALALGANGVCTARAAMKVLPKGKDEIVKFLNEMTGSLRHFMNRTSSPDIYHIDPSVIHQITF